MGYNCPGDRVDLEGRGLVTEERKEETSRLTMGKFGVKNRPLLNHPRRAVRETV